jgi:hypothetical protein
MAYDLLPDPVGGIRLLEAGPLGFDPLRSLEPLIERIEPCVWWKLRGPFGLFLRHASLLCVAPPRNWGQARTWNMAVN